MYSAVFLIQGSCGKEQPQGWPLLGVCKIPSHGDEGKGALLQLCNAESVLAQLLTLLGASLKPTCELIHEATRVEISLNLWLETVLVYLGRK